MPPKTVRIYGIDDLVFAKIKGYPPWPARIEENLPPGYKPTPGRYPVFFFGTYETAVVAAKDLYPYEQYKHQFGIKRKMKHFNEGLDEIEKTPHMSTKDTEDLIRMREERAVNQVDDNDASDSSFQKSDDNSSDISSNESESSVHDDSNKKNKKKNGKFKGSLNKSNRKPKSKISSDESEDDSDSNSEKYAKSKLKEIKSSDTRSKKSSKNDSQKLKSDTKNKRVLSKKSKVKKPIDYDSEVSKSAAEQSNNDSSEDEINRNLKTNLRKGNISENDELSKSPKHSSNKSIESDSEMSVNNNSDSNELVPDKKYKRIRIESNSDSDSKQDSKKSKDNLEDVIKLKQKLQDEKLAQKLEEKVREKERRKKEKMEQKRLERIKKPQESDPISSEGNANKSIGDILASIDQSIKLSLSINNANVNKCLDAMESINQLKISSFGISTFSNQLRELIQTLKKCRKYKPDEKVREKAQLCLTKFKGCFTSTGEVIDLKNEPNSKKSDNFEPVESVENLNKYEAPITTQIEDESVNMSIETDESLNKNEDSKESVDSSSSCTSNSTPLNDLAIGVIEHGD